MANTTEKPKSNAPLLIIGAVLVVALVGGWYWFSSSKPVSNTNSNSSKTPTAANKASVAFPPNAPIGANPPNQLGSPTAAVTLEEFADFQCPQCAATHPILNEIKSMYGSRIRFIYRNFPLDIPAHDKSYNASVAAEAAGMQGKFWDMQNMLFSNQKAWTSDPNYKAVWKEYATKIGLDINQWENDQSGIAAKSRVDEDKKRGKSANINSTPTLFVNGVEIPFAQVSVAGLKQIIDAELAKAAPAKDAAPANPAATAAPPASAK